MSSTAPANSVLQAWQTLQFTNLQKELDETASEIATQQDDAEKWRKKLIDQSKEFKQNTPDTVRKQVSPLLKSFQGEIDKLTNRGKAAENAFLQIYKKIIECPDPTPLLESAVQWQQKAHKNRDLELEVENLRKTLAQYNEEFADVKNQEVTVRQLRERIKAYEEQIDNAVEEKVKEREVQLEGYYKRREHEMQEAGGILSLKLKESERRAAALQKSMEAAQQELFTLRARSDESTDARSNEMDMLAADLEQSNQRAELGEREIEALRQQLIALRQESGDRSGDVDQNVDLSMASMEVELSAKDRQIAKLMDEVKEMGKRLDKEQKAWKHQIEVSQADLKRKTEALELLDSRLTNQADYDDLKRELGIIKSIEFGAEAAADTGKTLEVLLLEKNKSLQAENTSLKGAKHQAEGGTSGIAPFQKMVEAMSCLVGAELVNSYNRDTTVDRDLREKLILAQVEHVVQEVVSDEVTSNDGDDDGESNEGGIEMIEMKDTVKEEPDPFDFDQAIIGGTPRTIAEQQAICELQAIVAENVRKLGSLALNTPEIAVQCRRMMLAYNLGQRLFAKIVLNQSQGSLSELLSKPRPWQRLTEKGREAFRRIFAWVSDERAINLLRALSPRRVTSAGLTEKIDQPPRDSLIDKSICANSDSSYNDIPSTSQTGVYAEKPLFTSTTFDTNATSISRQNSRWKHDDIPTDKIFEIFHREKMKLKEQETTLENAMRSRPSNNHRNSDSKNSRQQLTGSSSSIFKLEQLACNPTSPSDSLFPQPNQLGTRCLKAGLPAISQEQFERFSYVDTEELVVTIKEFLSQHSISQRQFGENVLGLSQGSVSDLLARPKPWTMLTQKGREPFIRMQMFLEDKSAVEQLKNRKTNGSSPVSPAKLIDSPMPVSFSRTSSNASATSLAGFTISDIVPLKVDSVCGNALDDSNTGSVSPCSSDKNTSATTDLNTYQISRQVKEILHTNGIGQKTFGEAVLGVSQGTVSDLLSKPKHWSGLSLRGREPYLRMQQWLQDPNKLDAFKDNKWIPTPNGLSNSAMKRAAEMLIDECSPKKSPRTVISEQQREALKFAFAHDPHPTSRTIDFLASELGLNSRTVINWFYNHRTRQKFTPDQQATSLLSVPNIFLDKMGNGVESENEWRRGLMDLISMFSSNDNDTGTDSIGNIADTSDLALEDNPDLSIVKVECPSPNDSTTFSEFSIKSVDNSNQQLIGGQKKGLDRAIARMKEMAAANAV